MEMMQKVNKIDIVSHSMGFAYAKGVADFLSQKDQIGNNLYLSPQNKLGNFYAIAPENAVGQIGSSAPEYVLQTSNFENVYQYGTDFENERNCRQDGVAPQIRINGLGDGKNAYIPKKEFFTNPYTNKKEDIRRFIAAHSVSSFYWIFTEPLQTGKVIKRN